MSPWRRICVARYNDDSLFRGRVSDSSVAVVNKMDAGPPSEVARSSYLTVHTFIYLLLLERGEDRHYYCECRGETIIG